MQRPGPPNGNKNNNRAGSSNDPSSSFFIAVPSNLPPPMLNHRWASESSSVMMGDGSGGKRSSGSPKLGQQQQQGRGGAAVLSGGGDGGGGSNDDGGMFGGDHPAKAGRGAAGGAACGFDEHCKLSPELIATSPFFRTPPPPPPVFDASIPRQRFIAKIMRWYQVVEEWCDERRVARFDRDRLIVAPPPRPPLFVEGEALFAIPNAAQRSPYTVNEWAVKCHMWWIHVHGHFHRIHTQVLGPSVVDEKQATVDRPAASMLRLVGAHCVVSAAVPKEDEARQQQQQEPAGEQQEQQQAGGDDGADRGIFGRTGL